MPRDKKNVFVELNNLRIDTDLALKSEYLDEKTKNFLKYKKAVIKEIKKYLEEYKWIKHKSTIERVKAFHSSGFKSNIAYKLFEGVSQTSFETSMWYAGRKFKESIGKNTLSLLSRGEVDEALRQFRIKTGKLNLSTLIAKDIVAILPEADNKKDIIFSHDCTLELKILKQLTLKSINSVIDRLNQDKLSFLRYILEDTDPTFAKQRELIYKFLEGETEKLDTLISLLEKEETS